MTSKYYDGTKLLSMKDINGKPPLVYMVTSNRTAGKTTFWHRYLFNRFLKHGEKFGLIYRYKEMLSNLDGKYFKDIGPLFFPDWVVKAKKDSSGAYVELFACKKDEIDNPDAWKSCGYGLAINTADKVKNYAHFFSDVSTLYFDEFQAEFAGYVPNEANKLDNLHTSIARGQGQQARRVPLIMSGNTVSIINPYFILYDIPNRIQSNTKFLKGDKFVLECNFNESASKAVEENSLFPSRYNQYQSKGVYCLDSTAFIQKKKGQNRYLYTILMHNNSYAVRLYEDGIIFIDKRIDKTSAVTIAGDVESHNIGSLLDQRYFIKKDLLNYFNRGLIRFYDVQTKTDILEFLTSIYH